MQRPPARQRLLQALGAGVPFPGDSDQAGLEGSLEAASPKAPAIACNCQAWEQFSSSEAADRSETWQPDPKGHSRKTTDRPTSRRLEGWAYGQTERQTDTRIEMMPELSRHGLG